MEMPWFIPVLLFFARICDVSIGTMRFIFTISGSRFIAAGLGFVEVTIWVLAVGGALRYLSDPLAVVAYAGGFASGTLIGITIEDRLAMGYRAVRFISANQDVNVCDVIRDRGFRCTRMQGHGRAGPVEIGFCVVRRRHLKDVLEIINRTDPTAFVSVERADRASGGPFVSDPSFSSRFMSKLMAVRK